MELLNLPRETISAGGTGNLTLAELTGYPRLSEVVATSIEVPYAILDGDFKVYEVGRGHLSDANTFVRDTIDETFLSGTFDDTSPAAFNVPSAGYFLHTPATKQALNAMYGQLTAANSWTGQQTFKELKETVYTITDAAGVEIDPVNGTIQLWTLTASRTPQATNFEAGQSVTLMINDGTAYTVTWSTIGVVWVGGNAPTLATSGYTVVVLWKVASTVYGLTVGTVA